MCPAGVVNSLHCCGYEAEAGLRAACISPTVGSRGSATEWCRVCSWRMLPGPASGYGYATLALTAAPGRRQVGPTALLVLYPLLELCHHLVRGPWGVRVGYPNPNPAFAAALGSAIFESCLASGLVWALQKGKGKFHGNSNEAWLRLAAGHWFFRSCAFLICQSGCPTLQRHC